MKRSIYILTLFLFISQAGSAQYLAKYSFLPKKYADPDYMVSTTVASDFTDVIWRTFTDRDSVIVYANKNLTIVKDTLEYLKSFVVWEETEYALRIVSQGDSGEMFSGNVFGEGAIERGWVDKNQMILWPGALKKDGLLMKAIISESKQTEINNPLKPTQNIVIPEGEFRIYNVLKIDGSNLLLFKTDFLHDGLKRDDAFWVDKMDVNLLYSRSAYYPVWENVLNGDSIPVYNTLSASEDQLNGGVLYSINKINTFSGFFSDETMNILGLPVYALYNGRFRQAYINNVYQDFEGVILTDLHQFLIYKELIEIFASYDYYDPEDLEVELINFFKRKGLDAEEIEFMTVGEMLELITGINVEPNLELDIRRVGDLSYAGRNHLLTKFSESTNIYSDEQQLNLYRFASDLTYYWLPKDWFLPNELYSLALKNKELPAPPARDYKNYEVYYIDGSAVSNMQANVFDKIYDNIRDDLNGSNERALADSTYGFYTYMSNGINTLKNDYKISMERTVQEILLAFRNGTYFPDRKGDKMIIESDLLLHQIEMITESLKLHFYIPERYLKEDIEERCYMIRELADRLYSISMHKHETQVTIYLHVYSIFDERQLNEAVADMLEVYFPESKHAFKVIVERYN